MESKLDSNTGREFDTQYIQSQIQDHKKRISKLTDAEPKVQIAAIHALIAATLPFFDQHLALAEAFQRSVANESQSAFMNGNPVK